MHMHMHMEEVRHVKAKCTCSEARDPALRGRVWELSEQKPENFTLIVFYRGAHCPICRKQLQELLGTIDFVLKNAYPARGDA
jgi:peroxiredoxin